MSHQERGTRYGEGLFVEVGAAEQQQDVAVMFSFIKLEHLREVPQLVQVRRELQPAWRDAKEEIIVPVDFSANPE